MEHMMIQDMNKEERMARAIMLMNSYKNLMVYDIAFNNNYGEYVWKKEFQAAVKIVENMLKMRGKDISVSALLR